jgi:uncharacterized membrane protein
MNKTNLIILGTVALGLVSSYLYSKNKPNVSTSPSPPRVFALTTPSATFLGETGETLAIAGGQVTIPASSFTPNQVRYFNTEIEGKKIYFMVVKDRQGVYRAAANACEVCFQAKKGFTQQGDSIVCNSCGNKFSLDTLGITKGGCNPGPISPNVPVVNNQLILNTSQLSQVANLF